MVILTWVGYMRYFSIELFVCFQFWSGFFLSLMSSVGGVY